MRVIIDIKIIITTKTATSIDDSDNDADNNFVMRIHYHCNKAHPYHFITNITIMNLSSLLSIASLVLLPFY